MNKVKREGTDVIGTFIDALDLPAAIESITVWAESHQSRTVCLCNVHSSVTARSDQKLAHALSLSDMVLPDGAPVAWVMRKSGYSMQRRIAGPDLMIRLCEDLQKKDISIFLFGSSQNTLDKLESNLHLLFPGLQLAGSLSPKYGDWSNEEEQKYIDTINASGAGIIFIGLGCPKQEIWMVKNRERINGVMLGVGAAFDFHAGTVKRAPEIYQQFGLEWLHRLLSEPRRLWKRYLLTNTLFIIWTGKQLLQRSR
ncbi:MAG: WecB/TagA/CpsF family glycosyltransferase [Gammaproteobacteria bacterium]|jgi:N-acetylglucosaminyldiphosphoundecaprenol N-acetyl-beta-D-mannosaminyltransferase|nr:WecB/TagA/CpsF family glycosyltransferase [Gammaproteobacteria bacterium]